MSILLRIVLLMSVATACRPASDTTSPASTPGAPASVDVVELGADEALRQMAAGTLTSRALTDAYLARIAEIDEAGPALQSVIEINSEAVREADARDVERKAGKVRGPLHGLPILLKDNIDAAGMVNSAGSLALADNRPKADAFLVAKLREAGAVILGKTNLSEWANFRSTRSTSGWSSRGGQTRNPYVLDRNPCGSSSGTGTAIAASLAAIGVGTETDGSIICPAAVAGLAGLKPTVGLVSRSGVIPISISQDTAGPMGRTVTDVALLLNGLAGVDPSDPASGGAKGRIPEDYAAGLAPGALAGKRLGLVRQAMGYHPDVDATTEKAVETLKAAGAEVIDVTIPTYNKWNDAEFTVLLYEFKDGLNKYLANAGAKYPTLESLIEFNNANAERVMPFFGQEIFLQAQEKGPITEPEYLEARELARRLAGDEGLLATLDRHRLDALVAPSTSPAWPTDHVLGDRFLGAGYGMAAVAGTPSLTVPSGDIHGLPIGLTFMGRAYSEADLLAIGYAFEQAARARKPPAFAPTVP